jgi:hypothetical protein
MTAVVGTAVIAAIGAMTIRATVGGITVAEEAITRGAAITMAEAAAVNPSIKSGA